MADQEQPVLFVRMDEDLHARIKTRAEEVGIPVAEWARRALTHALDKPIREYTKPTVERV